MNGMNRVFLVGNLTRDPQVRQTSAGQTVCDLGLAVTERYRNKDGETVDQTCFVDIVAWARQAETCGSYLAKGKPVLVEGRLQFDQWQTDDGQSRNRLRVRADRVHFLGRPRDAADHGDAPDDAPPAG
jgi:single-strand DNA-binding protein